MAVTDSTVEAVSIDRAVEELTALQALVRAVDVGGCSPGDLAALTRGARVGQQAIDSLLMRVGAAADRQAASNPGARDAHGVLLGDGQQVRGATARREAARARTIDEMVEVGAAVRGGRLGGPQVDAIAQASKQLTPDQRKQLDTPRLVEIAESEPADVFARHVRRQAERIKGDHGLAETKAMQVASTWKHWRCSRTGMGTIHAEFDPERYETIVTVVEQQLTRLANEGGVAKNANLAAQAAFELLTGAAGQGRGLPHLNVVVDWETLAEGPHDRSLRETGDGHPLPPESIARLACDAVLQRIAVDGNGVPLDVGRKYRTATDAQWQAMRTLYRTCAWDGCDRPLSWCQLHHIHEWERGGNTDLCNLIPLCGKHHHAVHEGGWSLRLGPDRRLDIFRPDGRRLATTRPDRDAGIRGAARARATAGSEQPQGP